jgi:CRISPR/Cas system-associated exonuclease Cas4 (RecB family)
MGVPTEIDYFACCFTKSYMRSVFGNRRNYTKFRNIHNRIALELVCRGLFV